MQAFTAQRLTHQTTDNPFTNSYLLATLIIPHLETYLAAHSETRFLLLEYSPEHLATILALQKLVGLDIMKVAQIVDSNAKDPLPFTHVRGASISGRSNSTDSQASGRLSPSTKPLPRTPTASPEHVSLTKANFLLTSTATDSEIATFISTVWKILTEISQFYVPEESSKLKSSRRNPSPLSGSFSPFPKVTLGIQSPPQSPGVPPKSVQVIRPASPALSSKAPSVAETVKTTKSAKNWKQVEAGPGRHCK
jgi:hypothetical protein